MRTIIAGTIIIRRRRDKCFIQGLLFLHLVDDTCFSRYNKFLISRV